VQDDKIWALRVLAALNCHDSGDAQAALQGLQAHVAAFPSLAYSADIPVFAMRIEQVSCKG